MSDNIGGLFKQLVLSHQCPKSSFHHVWERKEREDTELNRCCNFLFHWSVLWTWLLCKFQDYWLHDMIWQKYSCTQAVLKFNSKSAFYLCLHKGEICCMITFSQSHCGLLWLRVVFSVLKIGFPFLLNVSFIYWQAERDTELEKQCINQIKASCDGTTVKRGFLHTPSTIIFLKWDDNLSPLQQGDVRAIRSREP